MFVALDEASPSLRPAHSGIGESDWKALSRFWYPVAVEADVEDKPVKGRLLDVELVIYRAEGKLSVALDVCPHRHVRLSAGEIVNDRLVCPFHGLAFNAAGQCTKVPALGRDAKLPSAYRLRSFRAQVKYGLVWTCLDDASTEEIPSFPAFEQGDAENRLALSIPHDWPVSSPRQMENFLDLAHIPFVHEQTVGTAPDKAIPAPKIERTNAGFRYTADSNEHGGGHDIRYTYNVVLPFNIEFQVFNDAQPEPRTHTLNLPAPLSATTCRAFWVALLPFQIPSRKSAPAPGDDVGIEDRAVLQHQGRHPYHLDQKSEIHLPCDNVSLEFRRGLRELGLGRSAA